MDDDNLRPEDEYLEISGTERWVYNRAMGSYEIYYRAGPNDFRSFGKYTAKMPLLVKNTQ